MPLFSSLTNGRASRNPPPEAVAYLCELLLLTSKIHKQDMYQYLCLDFQGISALIKGKYGEHAYYVAPK